MIVGLEVSQLVALYEIASETKETVACTNHHVHHETPKVQQDFLEREDGAWYLSSRMPDSQSSEPGFESPFATVSKIGHFRSLH